MFSLQVKLVRAEDLPASDFGFMGMGGKSDPYVTLKVGRNSQKSSVVSSSLNPRWAPPEVFHFQLDKPKEKCLEIQVFDFDRLNSDDLLGTANIALAPFLESRHSELISYDLDVPAEFDKQNRKSAIFLDIKLTSTDHVDQILELWENQRYHIVKKWTTDAIVTGSNERKRWSSVNDANVSSDAFEDVAPKCPPHLKAEGWTLDVSQGDDNGWIYAPSFSGPWQKNAFTLAMVRRRKWINKCSAAQ
ncbi:C2 domain-containing protein, partial [Globisporangium splendens]